MQPCVYSGHVHPSLSVFLFLSVLNSETRLDKLKIMEDDSEWMKLPVDQKCEHKVNLLTCRLNDSVTRRTLNVLIEMTDSRLHGHQF